MQKETSHQNLRGRSIFLAESAQLLGDMFAHCSVIENMGRIKVDTEIPGDLLERMNKENIESAIVHTARPADEQPILDIYEAYKKVVVIKRNPPATQEELQMYQRFETAGISTVEKRLDSFQKALDNLSILFEE